MQTIYLGADHNGFDLKEQIKKYLDEKKIPFIDLGNTEKNKDDDYPEYAVAVAQKVAATPESTGILICGSSHGMCITANKVKGIRATEIESSDSAKLARQDTDANIMCISGWEKTIDEVTAMIDTWLATPLSSEERHHRRLDKIREIEQKNFL